MVLLLPFCALSGASAGGWMLPGIDWFALVVRCRVGCEVEALANSILFQILEQPFLARPLCVLCSLQLVRASILPTPTTAARLMPTEFCECASGLYASKTTLRCRWHDYIVCTRRGRI